jgi:hypothetical protein
MVEKRKIWTDVAGGKSDGRRNRAWGRWKKSMEADSTGVESDETGTNEQMIQTGGVMEERDVNNEGQ